MTDELRKQATSTAWFIRAPGVFWHADQVRWSPGPGRGNRSELLGSLGMQAPKLHVVNFSYLNNADGSGLIWLAEEIWRRADRVAADRAKRLAATTSSGGAT